jgi:hypothetical protein
MKILIGYDDAESADAPTATAGKPLAGSDVEAIVLSAWELAERGARLADTPASTPQRRWWRTTAMCRGNRR